MPRSLAPTIAPDYRLPDTPRHSSIGTMTVESIVPLMTNTWADRFQHATIQAAEYWTGSAWTVFPSVDTVKNVFSGYPGTTGASLNSTTYPKWRVSFSGMSSSYAAMLQIYQEYGPPKGYKVTLEESADNVAWTTLLAETTVADGIYYSLIPTLISYGAYVRVTIEHTTTAHSYAWRNIRFLSDRCNGQGGQQLGLPFSWNYDKAVTFGGAIAVPTFAQIGANPATSGVLRLPNGAGGSINFRSADNTTNYAGLWLGTSNALQIAGPGMAVNVQGSSLSVGANPAAGGVIRLPAAGNVTWRNTANTADGLYISTDPSDSLIYVSPAWHRFYCAGAVTLDIRASQLVPGEGTNLVLGTTTGTKWGTAGNQKQAWWNATPVVQNTGWTATAGYTALRSFNPQTTTLAETARVLGTLVDTLKSYGLLG